MVTFFPSKKSLAIPFKNVWNDFAEHHAFAYLAEDPGYRYFTCRYGNIHDSDEADSKANDMSN